MKMFINITLSGLILFCVNSMSFGMDMDKDLCHFFDSKAKETRSYIVTSIHKLADELLVLKERGYVDDSFILKDNCCLKFFIKDWNQSIF